MHAPASLTSAKTNPHRSFPHCCLLPPPHPHVSATLRICPGWQISPGKKVTQTSRRAGMNQGGRTEYWAPTPESRPLPARRVCAVPSDHWVRGREGNSAEMCPWPASVITLVITLPHSRPVQTPSQYYLVVQSCREARQSHGPPFSLLKVARIPSCHSGEPMDMGHGTATGEPVEHRKVGALPCLSSYEAPSVTVHEGPILLCCQ